jgi:crotonobetainyl-CoA:carnitine CoA-transferase CaiB-like acyl-CoA transferase
MGCPELAADDRFATVERRHRHQEELEALVRAWTANLDRFEAFDRLAEAGVPAAPVLSYRDLYENPHLRERGFFEHVKHVEAGEWDMERPVYRFARRTTSVIRNGPCFAEHNNYVFCELCGLTDAEVAELEEEGITARNPNMSSHN